MSDIPALWTPLQTAKVLGISRSSLYNLMKTGDLESVHIGRSRRIAKTQVEKYVNKLVEGWYVSKQSGNRSHNSELQNLLKTGIDLTWSDNTILNKVQFGRDGTIMVDLGTAGQELGTSIWLEWVERWITLESGIEIRDKSWQL